MYEDLSNVQMKILDFIKAEINKKGYPPSVREIGAKLGMSSTSSVHYQLNNLEKLGYIKRDSSKQRALEVISTDEPMINQEVSNIPIIGRVAAGSPILASENIEDTFPIPTNYIGGAECFMLNVKGDSMIEAGILDGDMVIVKKQENAKDKDIVVALLEDEATVKTFFKEQDQYRLQPENKNLSPIYTKELKILGKVIGVIRMM